MYEKENKLLREELEKFGNVNNQNLTVSVLYNLKIKPSPVTEDEIKLLFLETNSVYYFSDCKGIDDYEKFDYAPYRKGTLKNRVIKLTTDLSIYKFPIYVSYNYNNYSGEWNGVYIGSFETIYERNFLVERYNNYSTDNADENSEPKINTKIANALKEVIVDSSNKEDIKNKKRVANLNTKTDTKKNIETNIIRDNPISPKIPICYSFPETKILAESIKSNIHNLQEWGNESEIQTYNIYKYLVYFQDAVINKLNNKTLDEKHYKIIDTADGSKYLIINSRLLNNYAAWIYLMYTIRERINKYNKTKEYYVKECSLLSNVFDLFSKGIDGKKVNLNEIEPIKFYNNKADLIFDGEVEDFDFELSNKSFYHIIEERKFRLPKNLQEQSPVGISFQIRNSIEYSVMMSKADYNYVVASYDIQRDNIQYLMPLFTDYNFDKKVETALVVNKLTNGSYVVVTILTIKEAYESARILNRPTAIWFR